MSTYQKPPLATCYAVIGGAGFIGSHMIDALLARDDVEQVTVFDNFASGQHWHLAHHQDDDRLTIIEGDCKARPMIEDAIRGHETVIHLASNPDIAAAQADPTIDFIEGTLLTQNVIEAMRRTDVKTILYASGSGIYGDLGTTDLHEDHGPCEPISTYGASKLAGETLIASYCHMFGMTGRAFRFANVVGPRQTHGVGYDFIRRLMADPKNLRILGDGSQSKPYIHARDVVDAVLLAEREETAKFRAYNVSTPQAITVNEIAALACQALDLDPAEVSFNYTGGNRGWQGDVPIVRLNSERIRALGWSEQFSAAEAMADALAAIRDGVKEGNIPGFGPELVHG